MAISVTLSGTIGVNQRGQVSGLAASASGGVGPYQYEWHAVPTAAYTPVAGGITKANGVQAGNQLNVAAESGTTYYKCVATDRTGATGVSSASAAVAIGIPASHLPIDMSMPNHPDPSTGVKYF